MAGETVPWWWNYTVPGLAANLGTALANWAFPNSKNLLLANFNLVPTTVEELTQAGALVIIVVVLIIAFVKWVWPWLREHVLGDRPLLELIT